MEEKNLEKALNSLFEEEGSSKVEEAIYNALITKDLVESETNLEVLKELPFKEKLTKIASFIRSRGLSCSSFDNTEKKLAPNPSAEQIISYIENGVKEFINKDEEGQFSKIINSINTYIKLSLNNVESFNNQFSEKLDKSQVSIVQRAEPFPASGSGSVYEPLDLSAPHLRNAILESSKKRWLTVLKKDAKLPPMMVLMPSSNAQPETLVIPEKYDLYVNEANSEGNTFSIEQAWVQIPIVEFYVDSGEAKSKLKDLMAKEKSSKTYMEACKTISSLDSAEVKEKEIVRKVPAILYTLVGEDKNVDNSTVIIVPGYGAQVAIIRGSEKDKPTSAYFIPAQTKHLSKEISEALF